MLNPLTTHFTSISPFLTFQTQAFNLFPNMEQFTKLLVFLVLVEAWEGCLQHQRNKKSLTWQDSILNSGGAVGRPLWFRKLALRSLSLARQPHGSNKNSVIFFFSSPGQLLTFCLDLTQFSVCYYFVKCLQGQLQILSSPLTGLPSLQFYSLTFSLLPCLLVFSNF